MSKGKLLTSLDVFHIKAIIPYTPHSKLEKDAYCIVAVLPDMPLSMLGKYILELFDFKNELFGFYNNANQPSHSKISYEHPYMAGDPQVSINHPMVIGSSAAVSPQILNMDYYEVRHLFNRSEKRWAMIFDYDKNWYFWLDIIERKPANTKKLNQYPLLIEAQCEVPMRYRLRQLR